MTRLCMRLRSSLLTQYQGVFPKPNFFSHIPDDKMYTPMMRQFWELKRKHPGYLLLYRMGDFYEMFFDDAVAASRILGIALTSRGRHNGTPIPMAGVPQHALEAHLSRLVSSGTDVAICEQMEPSLGVRRRNTGLHSDSNVNETPAPRKLNQAAVSPSIVRREVVRLVSAGTVTEAAMLEPNRHNYLVVVCRGELNSQEVGVAVADVSTGEFFLMNSRLDRVRGDVSMLSPTELLLPIQDDTLGNMLGAVSSSSSSSRGSEYFASVNALSTPQSSTSAPPICSHRSLPPSFFCPVTAASRLSELSIGIGDAGKVRALELGGAELRAAGALLAYLASTQPLSKEGESAGGTLTLPFPSQLELSGILQMDENTRRSLEVTETQRKSRRLFQKSQNEELSWSIWEGGLGIASGGRSKGKGGSLLQAIDRTVTPGGGRLLARRLSCPLTSVAAINRRLDAVDHFYAPLHYKGHPDPELTLDMRTLLRSTDDLQRCCQRLASRRGGPLDLTAVRATLCLASKIRARLGKYNEWKEGAVEWSGTTDGALPLINEWLSDLAPCEEFQRLTTHLEASLVDFPPGNLSQGGVIREGFNSELDELRCLVARVKNRSEPKKGEQRQKGHQLEESTAQEGQFGEIETLEESYRSMMKLEVGDGGKYARGYRASGVRVRALHVKGGTRLVLEVPPKLVDRVPTDGTFRVVRWGKTRVQYETDSLLAIQQRLLQADSQIISLEKRLFAEAVAEVDRGRLLLQRVGRVLSALDVACSSALAAHDGAFCRPEVDNSGVLQLFRARHAAIEWSRSRPGGQVTKDGVVYPQGFTPNDAWLEVNPPRTGTPYSIPCRGALLTGPNMGGKSTFLRLCAHAVLLAQAGLFVPAERARVGIVDKLFSRVGASDDLAADRSTFMVEMEETAHILKQATNQSLVIIDELGRGTSFQDGLAIAWATLEHLCRPTAAGGIGCRTLFASHYTELSQLAWECEEISLDCFQMEVVDDPLSSGGDAGLVCPVFTHRVVPGVCDKSLALQVASLAGIPSAVIGRALQLRNDRFDGGGQSK